MTNRRIFPRISLRKLEKLVKVTTKDHAYDLQLAVNLGRKSWYPKGDESPQYWNLLRRKMSVNGKLKAQLATQMLLILNTPSAESARP